MQCSFKSAVIRSDVQILILQMFVKSENVYNFDGCKLLALPRVKK